jgi:hypothetical protein
MQDHYCFGLKQIDRSRFSNLKEFSAPGGFGNVMSATMDTIEPMTLKSSGDTIDLREFMILGPAVIQISCRFANQQRPSAMFV